MQTDFAKLKELFLAALKLPDVERAAYLEAACAGDNALRQEIEGMLQSHEKSGELLPRSPAEMLRENGTTALDTTATLPAEPRGSSTPIERSTGDRNDLSFLAPPRKPGSLGRLDYYEILEVIGKGGFGMVLRAFDEKLHRIVAIKVLSLELSANGTARQRFIREARTAAAVVHEHVVTIHAVVEEHRPPYLVMQMIDGVTLQQKLDKIGTLQVREILRIGMQMAEGLAAAHKQGLVHRDIKPANILLENGVERVRITDFGLARAVDDASVTQSGDIAGTPMYMSPEQAEGLPIDHRSDLFSLGTVLYAMCTGHPPFRASGTHAVLKRVIDAAPRPIREINNEIPVWLCAIIAKLHAKKPEDRFQTAKEVAELLGQRLADVQAGREIAGEPKGESGRVEAPTTLTVPAAEPQSDRPSGFSAVWKSVLGWWSAGAAAGLICLLIVIPSVVAINSTLSGPRGLLFLSFAAMSLLFPMALGTLFGLIIGLAKWFFPSQQSIAVAATRFAFVRKMALLVVLSLLTIALFAWQEVVAGG
jgi:serine/threonine protein kinase